MFQILQLSIHQFYAAGLTLVVAWMITMARPVAQYTVDLWLHHRSPAWIDRATLLLQAVFLFSGVFFILTLLGTRTILVVAVVLLLALLAKNMHRSKLIITRVATLRTLTLRKVRPSAVVATVPMQTVHINEIDDGMTQPTTLLTASEPTEVVEVVTNAELTTDTTVATVIPPTGDISQSPTVVFNQSQLRNPVTLTRRPMLGKRTTSGLW